MRNERKKFIGGDIPIGWIGEQNLCLRNRLRPTHKLWKRAKDRLFILPEAAQRRTGSLLASSLEKEQYLPENEKAWSGQVQENGNLATERNTGAPWEKLNRVSLRISLRKIKMSGISCRFFYEAAGFLGRNGCIDRLRFSR